MRSGFGHDCRSVADIVGTVLLLGITVVIFGALSVAVFQQLEHSPPPPNVEFRVDTGGSRTTLTPVWGESLVLTDAKLLFHLNGVRTIAELTVAPLSANLAQGSLGALTDWDIGEPLAMGCPLLETCAYPGAALRNISVIQTSSNSVLYSTEPGISRGALVNPVADLGVTGDLNDPIPLPNELFYYFGATLQVTLTISNDGVLPTPASTIVDVEYFVDDISVYATTTLAGVLAPGDFVVVTHNPPALSTLGPHVVRVHIDANFQEAGFTNNDWIKSFTVVVDAADPGFAFEDGGNQLFSPYAGGDQAIPVLDILDGAHTAPPTKGLVIPLSVGSISPAGNILFSAPGAGQKLRIQTDLQTTGTITLSAGTDLELPGTVELRSAGLLSISAGGKIDISGDRLDTNAAEIRVTTTGGPLVGANTRFNLTGVGALPSKVTLTAVSGVMDLDQTWFDATSNILVTNGGNVEIQGAHLKAGTTLVFAIGTNTIYVNGAFVDDADDCGKLNLGAQLPNGTPAQGSVSVACL